MWIHSPLTSGSLSFTELRLVRVRPGDGILALEVSDWDIEFCSDYVKDCVYSEFRECFCVNVAANFVWPVRCGLHISCMDRFERVSKACFLNRVVQVFDCFPFRSDPEFPVESV